MADRPTSSPSSVTGSVGDERRPSDQAGAVALRMLRCRAVAQGGPRQLDHIRDLPPQPVFETAAESLLHRGSGSARS